MSIVAAVVAAPAAAALFPALNALGVVTAFVDRGRLPTTAQQAASHPAQRRQPTEAEVVAAKLAAAELLQDEQAAGAGVNRRRSIVTSRGLALALLGGLVWAQLVPCKRHKWRVL